MDFVQHEVTIQVQQLISLKVRLVYRSLVDVCLHSAEGVETFVQAVKVPWPEHEVYNGYAELLGDG